MLRKIMILLNLFSPLLCIYTNIEASQCFSSQGVAKCWEQLQKCYDDSHCLSELISYQKCSFGVTETDIFNGYCFRKWIQTAVHTQDMINCLNQECNLKYNSAIGVEELYECSRDAIIEHYEGCDSECLSELNKIRNKFSTEQTEPLFSTTLQNPAANSILKTIYKLCIQSEKQKPEEDENEEL